MERTDTTTNALATEWPWGEARRHPGSLRLRFGAWLSAVLVIVMAGMTGLTGFSARRNLIEAERLHAAALLDHLVQMESFTNGIEAARRDLAAFTHYLRDSGVRVDLVSVRSPEHERVVEIPVAERLVTIGGDRWVLRYSLERERIASTLRRTIAMHLGYALAAILAAVFVAEWVLRRHVLGPLGAVRNQLDNVGAGHGWLTVVPDVDRELGPLTNAVRSLGPALERQVWEWIETDRRANAALLLARVRGHAAAPLVRASGAAAALSPLRKPEAARILELRDALVGVEKALSGEELSLEMVANEGGNR